MEDKQKKTTKASTAKKQESKPKTTEKKKTTKSAKEVAKNESTKTARKTSKTVKKEVESKPAKAVKETVTKKSANTEKKATEKKVTRVQKSPSEKKTPKTVKKVEETKKDEVKKETKKVIENKPTETKAEKKQENVTETKNEVKEKNQETNKKKYVYISIGTIVCVIIILALILLNIKLGMHAYDVIKEDKATNSELEAQGQQQEEDSSDTTQEIGNVLKNDNEIAKQIINKITFSPNVTADIYNEGEFDINTISNNLKLKIGWEKTKEEKKVKSINENNEEITTLEKTTMDETIKEVFGTLVKCNSESFDYTDTERITYSEGMYTSTIKEDEGISSLTYQEVQKVVKYSEKIVVYVKTVYINVEDGKYVAYKNFEDGNFDDKLVELTSEELFGEVLFNNKTGEGAISLESNPALDSIRNKLNTYKYTFSIDATTQEYYLNEFGQE